VCWTETPEIRLAPADWPGGTRTPDRARVTTGRPGRTRSRTTSCRPLDELGESGFHDQLPGVGETETVCAGCRCPGSRSPTRSPSARWTRRSHARPHATGGAGEHDVAGTQDREGGACRRADRRRRTTSVRVLPRCRSTPFTGRSPRRRDRVEFVWRDDHRPPSGVVRSHALPWNHCSVRFCQSRTLMSLATVYRRSPPGVCRSAPGELGADDEPRAPPSQSTSRAGGRTKVVLGAGQRVGVLGEERGVGGKLAAHLGDVGRRSSGRNRRPCRGDGSGNTGGGAPGIRRRRGLATRSGWRWSPAAPEESVRPARPPSGRRSEDSAAGAPPWATVAELMGVPGGGGGRSDRAAGRHRPDRVAKPRRPPELAGRQPRCAAAVAAQGRLFAA